MREAFKKAFAARHPEFLAKDGRELIVTAKVEEISSTFETVDDLLASLTSPAADCLTKAYKEAELSPMGDNGKPRTLKLTAWIAHAPKPNLNRDAFTEADLQTAVENGLFQAPYCGMVDYNHDFTAYGAWYSAKYQFDSVAGQNGILAEGFIFAWRYEELANFMLAMQQRQGHIDVSMACMPTGIEFGTDAEGNYYVLRNPVFFTTSVLDVDPADPDARALGSEDITQSPSDREAELLSLATKLAAEHDLTIDTEDIMKIEELLEAFRKVVSEENQAQFAPLVEAFTKLPIVEAEVVRLTKELETKDAGVQTAFDAKVAELEALTAKVTELEAKLTEASVASDAMKVALETANAELETLKAFKAEIDAKEVEAARVAKRTTRLAELSEDAHKVLATRDEATREALYGRWEAMEQAEWEVVRDSLNIAKVEKTGHYEGKSLLEGSLASGGTNDKKGKFEIDAFVK
jgi:hypothetical protein